MASATSLKQVFHGNLSGSGCIFDNEKAPATQQATCISGTLSKEPEWQKRSKLLTCKNADAAALKNNFLGQTFGSPYHPGAAGQQTSTATHATRGQGMSRVRRRPSRSTRGKDDTDFFRELRLFLSEVGLPTEQVPSVRQLEQYGRRDLADGIRIRGTQVVAEQLMKSSRPVQWSEPEVANGKPNGHHVESVNGLSKSFGSTEVDIGSQWSLEGGHRGKEFWEGEASLRDKAALFVATGQLNLANNGDAHTSNGVLTATKRETQSFSSPWNLSEQAIAVQKAALLKARLKRRQADSSQAVAVDAATTSSLGQIPQATAYEGNGLMTIECPKVPLRESEMVGEEISNNRKEGRRVHSPVVFDTSQPFDTAFRLDSEGQSEDVRGRRAASPYFIPDLGAFAGGTLFSRGVSPAASPRHVAMDQSSLAALPGSRHMAEAAPAAAAPRASARVAEAETSVPLQSLSDQSPRAGTLQELPAIVQRGGDNASVADFDSQLDTTEADTIRLLKQENEELFRDILHKQKEIQDMSAREKQLQEEFKIETQRELQRIKDALVSREEEVASMVRELEEAKGQFKLMRVKAMAELSQTQQLLEEKDQRLKVAEQALQHLKRVKVEYWGEASDVKLAGSFNGWSHYLSLHPDPTSAIPQADGSRGPMMWDVDMYLYPGTYQVKFIVDGKWVLDPRREVCSSGMTQNNVIHVSEDDE